jgi:hypothetical protein
MCVLETSETRWPGPELGCSTTEKFQNVSMIYPEIIQNVDCVWNAMAHAQKPDFVFWRNRRVHLLGASVQLTTGSRGARISCSNAGYTMLRGSVKGTWLPTPFASFPFTSPPMCHRVPSLFNWILTPWYITRWVSWCSPVFNRVPVQILAHRLSIVKFQYFFLNLL